MCTDMHTQLVDSRESLCWKKICNILVSLVYLHTSYLIVLLSWMIFYEMESHFELFPDTWCYENLTQLLLSMCSGHWCPFQEGHSDCFLSLGLQQGQYWTPSWEVLPSCRRKSKSKSMVHTNNIITWNNQDYFKLGTHRQILSCSYGCDHLRTQWEADITEDIDSSWIPNS